MAGVVHFMASHGRPASVFAIEASERRSNQAAVAKELKWTHDHGRARQPIAGEL